MNIVVENAKHLENYKVEISFNDKTSKIIDFEDFLSKASHPIFNQYKDLKKFEKFKIEMGNLVWGKNWDFNFSNSSIIQWKNKNIDDSFTEKY